MGDNITQGEKHIARSSCQYFSSYATRPAEEVWQQLLNIRKMPTSPAQSNGVEDMVGKKRKKEEKDHEFMSNTIHMNLKNKIKSIWHSALME